MTQGDFEAAKCADETVFEIMGYWVLLMNYQCAMTRMGALQRGQLPNMDYAMVMLFIKRPFLDCRTTLEAPK